MSLWSAGIVATLVTSSRWPTILAPARSRRSRATADGSSPRRAACQLRSTRHRVAHRPRSQFRAVGADRREQVARASRRRPRGSPPASGSRGSPRAASRPRPARRPPCSRFVASHAAVPGRCRLGGADGGRRGLRQRLGAAQHPGAAAHRPLQRHAGRWSATAPPSRGASAVGRLAPAPAGPPAMSAAIRRANTSPSSSEFDASRFAPCTPVQATSPQAYRPGIEVRPVQVGADPAGGVVGGRRHRDQVVGRVDAGRAAGRGDGREPAGRRLRQVAGVEPHVVGALGGHAPGGCPWPRRRAAPARPARAGRP